MLQLDLVALSVLKFSISSPFMNMSLEPGSYSGHVVLYFDPWCYPGLLTAFTSVLRFAVRPRVVDILEAFFRTGGSGRNLSTR